MGDAGDTDAQKAFEDAIRALQTEVSTSGAFLTVDAAARQAYARQIAAMAGSLRAEVRAGTITWAQAAGQAQEARNVIMELLRGRSTPIGRAVSEAMKMKGRTLNEIVAQKTRELYGPRVEFTRLSATGKDRVYAEIVKSAGKSNARISLAMQRLSYAGRSLLFVSLAMSVYSVSTAENKAATAGRELTVTGAGIAGGAAGGAIAGLACGPGAPVCVTVGAFVGGALAAFGVSLLW